MTELVSASVQPTPAYTVEGVIVSDKPEPKGTEQHNTETPKIIKDYKLGNTHVFIASNAIQSDAQANQTLQRIAKRVKSALS